MTDEHEPVIEHDQVIDLTDAHRDAWAAQDVGRNAADRMIDEYQHGSMPLAMLVERLASLVPAVH